MYHDDLKKEIQNEIDTEQRVAREKTLTPGLHKAIEIIDSHLKSTSSYVYEFQKEGSKSWEKVRDNQNIQYLIEAGFSVRRKK
jgi:hypothetical protein